MTVREVVLHHDVRAPADLSPRTLLRGHARRRAASVVSLMAVDAAAVVLASALAARLLGSATPDAAHIAVAVALTIVVFLFSGLYGRRYTRHSLLRILRAAVIIALIVAVAAYVFHLAVPRPTLAVSLVAATVLFVATRYLYDWALARVYPDAERRPVLLIGLPAACLTARRTIEGGDEGASYRTLGMLGDDPPPAAWQLENGLPALGAMDKLEAVVRDREPAEIVVADPLLARDHMPALIDTCRRHRIVLRLTSSEAGFGPAPVSYVPGFGLPLFVVRPPALAGLDFYVKRILDRVLAVVGLVVLAPLMLVIAVAIKLTSRGRVFFVDDRIGLNQRPFRCYKFRTMVRDAATMQHRYEELNEAGGAIFKIRDDPRLTGVGRFLRRSSLDELPQLLNVLKGDMSLVGPRPLPLRDFGLLDDVHKQRHVVVPGATGLWQVSGRSELSFDDMIELDFRYIETWSLFSDLVIMLRTIGVVIGLKGAY